MTETDVAVDEPYPYKILCIRSDDGTPVVMPVDEVCALLGIRPAQTTVNLSDVSLPLLSQLSSDVATVQTTLDDFNARYTAIKASYDAVQASFSSLQSDMDKIMEALNVEQGPVTLPPPTPKAGL